jgi:WD40 repeat protein
MQQRESEELQHHCRQALLRCLKSIVKAEEGSTADFFYCKAALEFVRQFGDVSSKLADVDTRLAAVKLAPNILATQPPNILCPEWFVDREQRSKFHHILQTPLPIVIPQPRNSQAVKNALFGRRLHALIDDPCLQDRCIRFFLSSTFTDTLFERTFILKDVMPYVRKYASARGIQVVLSEMRFGIGSEFSDSHQTSRICMDELENCKNVSAGLCYILIAGDKYGFRPFPSKIIQEEFENLVAQMPKDTAAVVQSCFSLDKSSLDEDGLLCSEYCLKHKKEIEVNQDFWSTYSKLQTAFRDAAALLWPNARQTELHNPLSTHPIKRYFFSVTEEEVHRGLFWTSRDWKKERILCFRRCIDWRASLQVCSSVAVLSQFSDISDSKPDIEAREFIDRLHCNVERSLEGVPGCYTCYSPIALTERGIDPADSSHKAYLKKFTDDFCLALISSVNQTYDRLCFEKNDAMDECACHLLLAFKKSNHFFDSEVFSCDTHVVLPRDALKQIQRYIEGCNQSPLIIVGESGSGKTFVMARAFNNFVSSLDSSADAESVACIRFLGTTLRSSSVSDLLASLCSQLDAVRDVKRELPSGFVELKECFQSTLINWAHGKLVMFLDALDQLQDIDAAHRFDWLPMNCLPSCVKIICSTLPDSEGESSMSSVAYAGFSILCHRLRHAPENIVRLTPDSNHQSLFMHILKLRRRTCSETVCKTILKGLQEAYMNLTPLIISIIANEACSATIKVSDFNWREYGSSVGEIIFALFQRLETQFGLFLTRCALSFITLSVGGISSSELAELCALDDDALAETYAWWVPPNREVPAMPMALLLSSIKPYVTSQGTDHNNQLITWYHRQFRETALRYFSQNTVFLKRTHQTLAHFFLGTWSGISKPYNSWLAERIQRPECFPGETSGNRLVRTQPLSLGTDKSVWLKSTLINSRRCTEAAHHLIQGGMYCEAVSELCQLEGICARSKSGQLFSALKQLKDLQQHIQEGFGVASSSDKYNSVKKRVSDYITWLHCSLHTIRADPEGQILATASMQQLNSVVRQEAIDLYWAKLQPRDGHASYSEFSFNPSVILGGNIQSDFFIHQVLHGHSDYVRSVAYSPCGNKVATVSRDTTLCVWDAKIGFLLYSAKEHSAEINCVAFSPDNCLIATGSWDKSVIIWDCKTGFKTSCYQKHSLMVTCVSWSPCSQMFSSGSDDKCIHIWRLGCCSPVFTLSGHTGSVWCISWSQQQDMIASGSWDCSVRLWSPKSQSLIGCLEGHQDKVTGVSWCLDPRLLASCSGDKSVRIWDVLTKSCTFIKNELHDRLITCISCCPRSNRIATASWDTRVKIWDVDADSVVSFDSHSGITCSVCWHPAGLCLTSCSYDKTAILFEPIDGSINVSRNGHKTHVSSVAWSSGAIVASGSEDGTVILWNSTLANTVCSYLAHSSSVLCLVFCGNENEYVVSGSLDHTVSLFDVHSQLLIARYADHTKRITSLSWSCERHRLLASSADATISELSMPSLVCQHVYKGHVRAVSGVAWVSITVFFVSVSIDQTIRVWQSGTQDAIAVFNSTACEMPIICCNVDGSTISTGCQSGNIQCWKIGAWINKLSTESTPLRRRTKLFHQIVAESVQFMSANDAPERDPVTFLLEGHHTASGQLDWKVIASGETRLPTLRGSFGPVVRFKNVQFFDAFRLTFPMLRDSCCANSMQLGSVRIFDADGLNILDLEDDIRPSSERFAIHSVRHVLTSSSDSKYLNFDKEGSGLTVYPSLLSSLRPSKALDVREQHNLQTLCCALRDMQPGCHLSGMAWIASVKLAASSSDGSVYVMAPWQNTAPLHVIKSHQKLSCFAFSRNRQMCASGHSDGKVRLIMVDAAAPMCLL